MSLLLDTHTAVWWWCAPDRLSATVQSRLSDRNAVVHFSAASALEIALKHRVGKLALPGALARDLEGCALDEGWRLLSISVRHAQRAGAWETDHRDPFDRLLAAQAEIEGLSLVSRDAAFSGMGVRALW